MKYKHLTLDDRIEIQHALKDRTSFIKIGAVLNRDASTISKEIKAHAHVTKTGTKSRPHNSCVHRKTCMHEGDICELCIQTSSWHESRYCSVCGMCNDVCPEFREYQCKVLKKPPYVCNGCKTRRSCTLSKCT
ncbi:helix-turn-helix domain-containing protein, partial [Aminicella lysinilytica]